jgi:hypothetical protein
MSGLVAVSRSFFENLWAALREIFDESAYERFLARNQVESSRLAWAAFIREQGARREKRARCC